LSPLYPTSRLILSVLADGKPKASAEIARLTGLKPNVTWTALTRYWRRKLILRSRVQLKECSQNFKGRRGKSSNLRSFYLYTLKPQNTTSLSVEGLEFVSYEKNQKRVNLENSKAKSILNFLRVNSQNAYFSTDIVKALVHVGVKPSDIMSNVRRWEKRGFVLVRGYRLDGKQTPFREGYLITWIDAVKCREDAIKDAIEKTELALVEKETTNPTIQRVHRFRDLVLISSSLRELVSLAYVCESLDCSKYEAEVAINRALQLYSDLKEVKLFNAFRYFYHETLDGAELKASISMKENYIRTTKGKANRIGHNWEAIAEQFIDKFTTGARFWTQNHRRNGMDARRITIHLIKSVRGRICNAEVDRVWEVNPSVFSPSITYVLSCKWGVVCKRDIDDFLDVLRWSKEFGVSSSDSREVKQGIVGVFAGSAFNPNERIRIKDDCTISLATYAARMNLQLLKASDFNSKLHERGCSAGLSVQKICRIAKNEQQVREIMEKIWEKPENGERILATYAEKNKETYAFERMLEAPNLVSPAN